MTSSRYSYLCLLIILFSCSNYPQMNYRKSKVTEHYKRTDVPEYFLSDLPNWANFSQSAQCRRTQDIQYFDLKKLSSSFNLKYAQSIQFQYLYNKLKEDFLKDKQVNFLTIRDEEILFYSTKDKIYANNLPFRVPSYKQINIIWIDPARHNKKKLKSLKALMSSKEMEEGHPVFISLCLSFHQLQKFISSNQFDEIDLRLIPQETFSIFSKELVPANYFSLNLDAFFKEDQKLTFFLPIENIPPEFQGTFELKFY